jgi:hypothetical membrane protein
LHQGFSVLLSRPVQPTPNIEGEKQMNQAETSSLSSLSSLERGKLTARWWPLAGVVGPILFIVVYTLAGFLRPGYSPVHQAISDLGVGPNAWLVDGCCIIMSLLLIGFAVGFALTVLPQGWRWVSAILLTLHGLGLIITGIFTEAPSTVMIHWLVGADLGFFGPVVAFLVTGLALRRTAGWRKWGSALLIAGLLTLVLIAIMFWIFTPGTLLASLKLGGLMERVVLSEIEVWYVALGWRLFALAGANAQAQKESNIA